MRAVKTAALRLVHALSASDFHKATTTTDNDKYPQQRNGKVVTLAHNLCVIVKGRMIVVIRGHSSNSHQNAQLTDSI